MEPVLFTQDARQWYIRHACRCVLGLSVRGACAPIDTSTEPLGGLGGGPGNGGRGGWLGCLAAP